jgi:hypothetical protein
MPECDNCGAHVSPAFYRVNKGNDGILYAHPSCEIPAALERAAAGATIRYQLRSTPDGVTTVPDGGATDE